MFDQSRRIFVIDVLFFVLVTEFHRSLFLSVTE